MATLAEILAQDGRKLRQALDLDPREARLEVQILLCHVLGVPRSYLIGHDRDALSPAQEITYAATLKRRLSGEPIAYIAGNREFYGLEFRTTDAVLIPRPETELLVDLALARIDADSTCKILDLGCGSGAIAIAIAKHRPLASVTAVERSPEALAVARENADRLEAGNVRLVHSDWFGALDGERFDLIVSNPPYIAAADPHLQQGDVRFEPLSALASGADGLDDIRAIAAEAASHLHPGGWLLFEHGYDQGARCREILLRHGFDQIDTVPDLADIPRVTLGIIEIFKFF